MLGVLGMGFVFRVLGSPFSGLRLRRVHGFGFRVYGSRYRGCRLEGLLALLITSESALVQ